MLEGIDALIALEKFGTVSEAAVRLRLTQSAVSKRIRTLERQMGFRVVEHEGRRLRLTPAAISLLERARPLVADLRGLAGLAQDGSASDFSIGLADSIASSWGPELIKRALQRLQGISVRVHAHRSVLLVESVRLGRYHIGMCTDLPEAKDLIHHGVVDEPLVLVNAGTATRPVRNQPIITIEPGSATWRAMEPQLRLHHPALLARPLIPVETFSAALQMVKAGFGDGVVPLGLAIEMKLDRGCYRALRGVKRHISLITRKTVNQLPNFRLLREQLVAESAHYFSKAAAAART